MSTEAAAQPAPLSRFERLRHARQILQTESRSLVEVAERLDDKFCRAVAYLYGCRGNVIVTGMGKAGPIGQKITATWVSTAPCRVFPEPPEPEEGAET